MPARPARPLHPHGNRDMLRHDPSSAKTRVLAMLRRIAACSHEQTRRALDDLLAPEARWFGCHPFGLVTGSEAVAARLWTPLKRAFSGLERRDHVFIGGDHHGDDWIAATGQYYGIFSAPFLGILETGRWAWLRFGEFYRLEDGRVAECYMLLDLPDLMRQAGMPAFSPSRGIETLVPGPATQDGVRLGRPDPGESRTSLALVDAMLAPLFEPTREAMGMERFWSAEMMWYGPSGIGATRGLDGFFRDHTDHWVAAMPDWSADLDTPHFADDHYVAFVGWPSIHATQTGDLLGLPATGRPVQINLMDFWRRDGDRLAENWVLIDFPHLFAQLGRDVLPASSDRGKRRPAGGSEPG